MERGVYGAQGVWSAGCMERRVYGVRGVWSAGCMECGVYGAQGVWCAGNHDMEYSEGLLIYSTCTM